MKLIPHVMRLKLYRLYFPVLLLWAWTSPYLSAQRFSANPTSLALGGSFVALEGFEGIALNPAAIAHIKGYALQSHFRNKYFSKEWNEYAIQFAAAIPNIGSIGIYHHAGAMPLFHRNKSSFSYARTIGPHFSAGMHFNYHYIFQGEGYGTLHGFSADAGIQVRFLKNFIWGFSVHNPIRMRLSKIWPERIPFLISTGFSYTSKKGIFISSEIEKDIDALWVFRLGIEYKFLENYALRIGFHTSPNAPSFGFGFERNKWKLNWASSYNIPAGMEMALSIAYQWKN